MLCTLSVLLYFFLSLPYDWKTSVAASDEHKFSLDGHSNQFITINVISLNERFESFGKMFILVKIENLISL